MERRRLIYSLAKQTHSLFSTRSPSNSNFSTISGVTKRALSDLRSSSAPRVFPSSGWHQIDPSLEIEEESLPNYRPEKFYPVRIGEVFNHQYQIVGKLGYGASATVWLARDLMNYRYVTLKVFTTSALTREIEIYNHLKTIQFNQSLQSCFRPLIEAFQTQNPDGKNMHNCLVHPPLGMSLDQLTPLLPGQVMDKVMVRTTLRNILAALDFLHNEAQIIHTDLQPNNILLGIKEIKDDSILAKFEQDEFEAPIPRKTLKDRTIYVSRPFPITRGTPVLCDFGEARLGKDQHHGDIMPDVYRAPEVILGMEWDYKVDIWNVGMVVWDLFERHHLFKARNPEGKLDDAYHLAEMQAVLGSPPPEFLARSERSLQFWDKDGNWKGKAPIPDYNLEVLETKFEGDEKDDILRFLRRMLCWLPEERATAAELIFDPLVLEGIEEALLQKVEGER